MKSRSIWVPLLVAALLGGIALAVYLRTASFTTTLQFTVRDAVSKGWVWDSTMTLQDRVIRGYYQSDSGPIEYRFTGLEPGSAELAVSAPAYEPVTVPVVLKRGRNTLPAPIELRGVEIPSLKHFIIFEDLQGSDLAAQIRPVGLDGQAVLNHPCLDLRIAARVSTQMKNGAYVQEETEEGSERGEELFRGRLEWSWDGAPETVFRYGARIPGSQIRAHPAPLRVVDYLLLVPDGTAEPAELDRVLEEAWKLSGERELSAYLEQAARGGRFRWFIFTSWNVKGSAP